MDERFSQIEPANPPVFQIEPNNLTNNLTQQSYLCWAPFIYSGPLAIAIRKMKYRGNIQMCFQLAQMLAQNITIPAAECVVPVPLHKNRLQHRGFNQSWIFAQVLAQQNALKCTASLFTRIKDTLPQASLNASERRSNLKHVMQLKKSTPRLTSVLVVDDVLTTGATLEAAFQCLKQQGVSQVWGAVLARTPTPQ